MNLVVCELHFSIKKEKAKNKVSNVDRDKRFL